MPMEGIDKTGNKMVDNITLFTDSGGRAYTQTDISTRLKAIGVQDCDILFVHTDVAFGRPNPALGRKGYLEGLYQALLELHVDTMIFPAFSYSFCNHEDYNVRESKTSMGALIEYVRKTANARRTLDPLLSLLEIGRPSGLMDVPLGCRALGEGSGFDWLHQQSKVKFLFFGADFSSCFTYIHHIEKILEVPYRYDQQFSGMIIDKKEKRFYHEHSIHTACGGVSLKDFSALRGHLEEDGRLKAVAMGNLEAVCVSERDVWLEVQKRLRYDPYSFVEPYTEADLIHEYTFGKNGERVTHC